jgi:hypothetical protein
VISSGNAFRPFINSLYKENSAAGVRGVLFGFFVAGQKNKKNFNAVKTIAQH